MEREIESLAEKAGIEPPTSPPPAGSLRDEIQGFSTLDACEKQHAPTDPLLADALDSLGYESLVRDACRSMEALAARDSKKCSAILAGSLRARCETAVATLTGDASLCPLSGASRDPLCLARARRDPRLCDGLSGRSANLCRALVSGDPSLCKKDASCTRQVARWASVFENPEKREPFVTKLVVEVRETTHSAAGAPVRAFDLGELAAGGFVVRKRSGRIELSLGAPRDATWLSAHSKLATPQGYFALELPEKPKEGTTVALGPLASRFDLLVPELASLSSVPGHAKGRFTVTKLVPELEGVVKLDLEAIVGEGARSFRVVARIESFVRDVMDGPR